MAGRERIYHPAPSNKGEPQSVRDAYDAMLAAKKAQQQDEKKK